MAKLPQPQQFMPEISPSNSTIPSASTQAKLGPSWRQKAAEFKAPLQPNSQRNQTSNTLQPSILGYWVPQYQSNFADTNTTSRQHIPSNTMTAPKPKQHQPQYFTQTEPARGAKSSNNRTNVYPIASTITPIQQPPPAVSVSAPVKAGKQHRDVAYAQAGAEPLPHARRQLFPDNPIQGSGINMGHPSNPYGFNQSRLNQSQTGLQGSNGYYNPPAIDRPRTPADRNQNVDWGAYSGSIHSSVDQQREARSSDIPCFQRAEQNEVTPAPASSQPADFGRATNLQYVHASSQALHISAGHQRELHDPQRYLLQHRLRTPMPAACEPPKGPEPNAKRKRPF